MDTKPQRRALFVTLAVLAFIAGDLPVRAVTAAEKPNFLLIVADDLTWRDLGVTGNRDVHSPNIDSLARDGMSLRGMFTPAPTCSPARHALYTGLFPVRSGAYPNHTMVDPSTRSIFGHLKAIGYRVGLQAKTHVHPPESFPFEKISNNADDRDAFANWIGRDRSRPWLAVFASHDPHGPWTRGPKDRYDPGELQVPPWLHDNPETRRALAAYYAEITALDGQVGACLAAIEASKQRDSTLVMFLSEQGSSFPYGGKWSLYDLGIRVACFVRWPGTIKPGSRSDALVQYVDVAPTLLEIAGAAPEEIDTGCVSVDGRRGFDGRSFLGVLQEKRETHREHIFAEHTTVGINGYREPYPIRAVRDTRYKLIRNLAPENVHWIQGIHGTPLLTTWERDAANDARLRKRVDWLYRRPAEELYDLQADPFETKNLAREPSHAEVKARLTRELERWMAAQGDRGMETELEAHSRQPRRAARTRAGGAPRRTEENTRSRL